MKRKVEKDTLVRTCLLFLALLNQCLELAGFCPLPVEEEEIYQILTGLLTAGASLWAWWKNNSFTQKALAADAWKEKQEMNEEEKEEKEKYERCETEKIKKDPEEIEEAQKGIQEEIQEKEERGERE